MDYSSESSDSTIQLIEEELNIGRNMKPFKIVKTQPGLCVKTRVENAQFKKLFINICHTDALPAPIEKDEMELLKEILRKDQNLLNFKIPMSISHPRESFSKTQEKVIVVDVAINSSFFEKRIRKRHASLYFLIQVVFEKMENDHGIKVVKVDDYVILQRLFFDELVDHTIYICDILNLYTSGQNELLEVHDDEEEDTEIVKILQPPVESKGKDLIEEIASTTTHASKELQHMLFDDKTKLIAEFYMPNTDMNEIKIQANDDRLVISTRKEDECLFDKCLPKLINEEDISAEFDKDRMILKVTMSVA